MNQQTDLIVHSNAAKRILDDEEFKRAVASLEEQYVNGWKTSQTVPQREAAFTKWSALRDLVAQLRVVFDRGETQKRLDDKSSRA